MGAMIATLHMDGIAGDRVFFVRFWNDVRDIGHATPEDTWEVSAIVPDQQTMNYLEDQKIRKDGEPMKAKLIRWIAEWLYRNYPYLLQELVVGHGKHIARNPKRRKLTAVVSFQKEGTV